MLLFCIFAKDGVIWYTTVQSRLAKWLGRDPKYSDNQAFVPRGELISLGLQWHGIHGGNGKIRYPRPFFVLITEVWAIVLSCTSSFWVTASHSLGQSHLVAARNLQQAMAGLGRANFSGLRASRKCSHKESQDVTKCLPILFPQDAVMAFRDGFQRGVDTFRSQS